MGLAVLKTEDLPHYTYDDYVRWEGRWEIINGIPYAMVPASAPLVSILKRFLKTPAKKRKFYFRHGFTRRCRYYCQLNMPKEYAQIEYI